MVKLVTGANVPTVPPSRAIAPRPRAGAASFQSTVGIAATELAPAINEMAKAQFRTETRRGIADRFMRLRAARDQSSALATELLASGNPLSENEMDAANKALEQIKITNFNAHIGTKDTQARLGQELQGIFDETANALGKENATRLRALIDDDVGDQINVMTQEVARNPALFGQRVEQAAELLLSTKGHNTQAAIDEQMTGAVSGFTEAVVKRQLAIGNVSGPGGAIDLLTNPLIQRMLDKETILQLSDLINKAEFDDSDVKGIPRDIFNRMDEADQKRVLLGGPLVDLDLDLRQGAKESFIEKLSQNDADRFQDIEAAGDQAISTKRETARMRISIESGRFTTGSFSDVRVFLARLAEFAGASDEVRDLIGDAATADTFDSAANRLGIDIAQKLSRLTNMSLQFIKNALPALSRTPEGNLILIEVMDRASDRDIEVARIANEMVNEFDTIRPKDQKSLFERVADLEDADPVISEELQNRIREGTRTAPNSFREAIKTFREGEIPPELVAPEGYTITGVEGETAFLRRNADGLPVKMPADLLRPAIPTFEEEEQDFDAEGTGFDIERARAAGMTRAETGENTGHFGSVAPVNEEEQEQFGVPPEAFIFLKGREHESFNIAAEAENKRGFKTIKLGDRFFSVPNSFTPKKQKPTQK